MAQNYINEGDALDWTNGSGSAVTSGTVVVAGSIVGVASGDIANGDSGVLLTEGIFELPKVTPLVIAVGDKVYFDNVTTKKVNKTNTDVKLGVATAAAGSADTTVKVKINFGNY